MANIDNKNIRRLIYNKFNGHCAYCGCELNSSFTIDHIQPKRRGYYRTQHNIIKGEDKIDNYNPSCYSCNSSKNELTIEKWRKELELKVYRLNRDSSQYRIAKRFGLIIETENTVIFYFEKYK